MVINRVLKGQGGSGDYASIFVTGLTQTDTITCTSPSSVAKSGAWVSKVIQGVSVSGWEFSSLDEYGTYLVQSGGKTEEVLVDSAEEFEVEWAIVPTEGLLVEYLFEGDYADTSGNGRNATAQSGATFQEGKVGYCYQGTGTSSGYVETALSKDIFNIQTRTIAMWINGNYTSTPSSTPQIFTGDGEYWTNGYLGGILQSASSSGIVIRLALGTGYIDSTITANEWHFIAIIQTSASSATVYVDGTPTAITPSTSHSSYDYRPNIVLNTNRNKEAHFGDWKIDQFRAYNRALTADEIASLYNNGRGV